MRAALFSLALMLRLELLVVSPSYARFDTIFIEYVRPILKQEVGLAADARFQREGWVVAAFYSLLLGTLGSVAANVITPRRWAWSQGLSKLDKLILEAQSDKYPIMLLLSSGLLGAGVRV